MRNGNAAWTCVSDSEGLLGFREAHKRMISRNAFRSEKVAVMFSRSEKVDGSVPSRE